MARFQGWKKRYSYLDDYKPGMDGKYVYYGRHYILEGGTDAWKKYRLMLFISSALLMALFVVSGVIEAGVFWSLWYTNLPFALKAIASFLFVWKAIALAIEKYPVKKHIYQKSVPWLKPCAVIVAAISVVYAVTTVICILTNREGILLSGCIIEIVLNLAAAAAGVILFKMFDRFKWDMDPSEEMEE